MQGPSLVASTQSSLSRIASVKMSLGPVVREVQKSDLLRTARSIRGMCWLRSTFTRSQPTSWSKCYSSCTSILDAFWKHATASRQNHNILCLWLLGPPFCRKRNSWALDGNEGQKGPGPLHLVWVMACETSHSGRQNIYSGAKSQENNFLKNKQIPKRPTVWKNSSEIPTGPADKQ